MQELVEQERFDELARDGEAAFARAELLPWQRRELAFYAVRGFHGVYAATGQPSGLCRARGLLRRVEREVGLDDDAATATRLREVTEAGLRQQGPKDPCVALKQASAGAVTATPARLIPVKVGGSVVSHRSPPAASQSVLIDISGRRVTSRPSQPPRATTNAPTKRPLPPPMQPLKRSRERTAGGAVLLVAAAGFGAGMAAALMQRSLVNAKIVTLGKLHDAEDRNPTEAELAAIARDNHTYYKLTVASGFLGVAAGVATVAGLALLTAPQRRRAPTVAVSASPWSATLSLRGRF